MELMGLNMLAVLVAAISGMVLGALWYSPVLFGKQWMAAIGESAEDFAPPASAMVGSLFCCLASALSLEIIFTHAEINTLLSGTLMGAVIAIGLVSTALLSDNLFCGWGRRLFWIQAGYRSTYIVVMSAIITAF